MHYRISFILVTFICLFGFALAGRAQDANTDESSKPVILYSGTPKKYEIADIKVEGVKNYEDYVLIGLSGLSVGQSISVPGDEITSAIKRYWRHGLFSNVKITAEKIEDGKVWLKISLTQRPRISEIRYHGVKKSERQDLETRLGLVKGSQITPNLVDRAKTLIKRYFDDKGFKNAEIIISQKDDISNENQVIVDVNIDKKEKIKVHEITIVGNKAIKTSKLKRVMKKTNEKGKLLNLFRTKKFINEKYEEDKQLIIDKYNELGYRDAVIVTDSVTPYDDKTVNVYMEIDEGDKYYLRNVTWVGNTLYPSEQLNYLLRMKKGDVYNQKLLNERLSTDEDAIGNLYYNNGYLFYNLDPVEINIDGDSIDLEMRIYEGRQATINKIKINGNDRLYENVVRRELRTRPGQLFSRDDLMRSMREIQQMGHFDAENIHPDIQPDPMNGTVDIAYDLVSKANDQVEFSAGWGQTGIIGKLSLKFTNFSLANLLHPGDNYRGILPQGDGQTLTVSGQTNAKYYQSYSISFFDPWFGGKRPNSFSISAFYSRQTDISSRYYNDSYYNNYYNSMYSGYGGYGMYNYGSGSYNNYENYYDPDKSIQMWGLSVGWGKRLKWPDDYFTLSAELSYQRYILKDWQYFPVTNGKCNNISLNLTLARSSIDNPLFPRQGSEFSLSAQITPPYSLFDGRDYKGYYTSTGGITQDNRNKLYNWVEYHKWKFKAKTYTALMDYQAHPKCLVLMSRIEFGLLGHYNKYKKSPFETFDVGGDGMTGYSSYATESVALRGYENSSLTPYGREGYAYTRLGIELRYPLMLETSTNIYVLGFLEAGNAWNDINKFNPFDLKRSAGVGVRIFLPMIGMMGIDWAYGFDKVFGSSSAGGSHFHFVLGQEF
ncbi:MULTISPECIES: outer membrane protein assembly factor [Bacteroides]|jgi:outer membrane protein insertion porin family|uniref:Outer membrane protein assembly complex, YaeT protein n=1 Tax=Bacteroides nordii CL02T12C05 TaxID=997884 RepID=I9H2B2_9BACE|nr:POTRA domain-containing protein [Bacteroides nordii]EIY53594.1 outer membrane protein assembly complex, YaeT protein [Bacteroides nordii CL02T12C05]MCE8466642.1 outer membrane protein assembly factor [Bacteroides nordii]MCG4768012.1 outer membrane protein assembly factor [Bacteroides nordii]MCQ4915711.1 outer membrane protein assembly factor [Bacteroides nordii]UYU48269.1 outer membrane protein assembly factor [Bacteroides nordii]